MSAVVNLLFLISLVLPPAAVLLGALTLLWPRRQFSTSTVVAPGSHAHAR